MSNSVNPVISAEDAELLITAINAYFTYNSDYNEIKKERDIYNNQIKEILKRNNIDKYSTEDGIKASLSVSKKPIYNELALIEFLKPFNIPDLIKTKEYVDMDVLEDCIYHGQIDAATLAPYKEDKVTETLRVTQPKILKS